MQMPLTSAGQLEDDGLHLAHGGLGAADDVLGVSVEAGARVDGVGAVFARRDPLVRTPVALDSSTWKRTGVISTARIMVI